VEFGRPGAGDDGHDDSDIDAQDDAAELEGMDEDELADDDGGDK